MSRFGPRRFGGAGGGGGGGGATTFLALTDTPGAFTAGQLVVVNAAGTALVFVPPSPAAGGGPLDVIDRANQSGGLLPVGTIVAPHATLNKSLVAAIGTADNQASRPVGILTEAGGIADTVTGAIRTISGLEAPCLLVAGLGALVKGEEVVLSLTAGSGTIPGSGVSEPVAVTTVKQRVGIIVDVLTYDGGADLLALVQIDFGQRRIN